MLVMVFGRRGLWLIATLGLTALLCGCGGKPDTQAAANAGDKTANQENVSHGSIEVIARLVEIPGLDEHDGDFPSNQLGGYDYAYVMKYRVQKVLRGNVKPGDILVAHYNPLIPRAKVADKRDGCRNLGGNVRRFREGDLHRLSLEVPIDDYYMGGIFNKYFGKKVGDGRIYWAVWTDAVSE